MKELIQEKLDDTRYHHSLCVADSAKQLASRYGAESEQAYLAGLLHDCLKCASEAEQRAVIARAGVTLHPCESGNPNLLHAIAGEAFLRSESIVSDPAVLSAVRWHTTGRADMATLEKIVYLADFISYDRDYPDVETVRRLAAQSLDDAILYTLRFNIPRLIVRERMIHPASIELYNHLLKGSLL